YSVFSRCCEPSSSTTSFACWQTKSTTYGPIACCLLNLKPPRRPARTLIQKVCSKGVSSERNSRARSLISGETKGLLFDVLVCMFLILEFSLCGGLRLPALSPSPSPQEGEGNPGRLLIPPAAPAPPTPHHTPSSKSTAESGSRPRRNPTIHQR